MAKMAIGHFGALLRSFLVKNGQILVIFIGQFLAVWGALFGHFWPFLGFLAKNGRLNGQFLAIFGHF